MSTNTAAAPADAASAPAEAKKTRAKRTPTAALVEPAGYDMQLRSVKTTILKPEQLERLLKPIFQRDPITAQVNRLRKALRSGEYLPDIILAAREVDDEGGKKKTQYSIVDGLQRATAAKLEGYSLRATVIHFGTEEKEREHFVAFQKSRKVDANLIVDIANTDPLNKEINRIANLDGHPIKDKIYFGRGERKPEQINATLIRSLVKYGLPQDEMEDFTRFLATVFGISRSHNACRSGGLRGVIALYTAIRNGFDIKNPDHIAALQSFDWAQVDEAVRINTPASGETVGKALLAHWNSKV